MATETVITVGATVIVGLSLGLLFFLIDFFRTPEQRDWGADFRALQLENNRYLQKVHDENARLFRSMGLTQQQILERVDRVD